MIGVFDSGFGGLTILRALRDLPLDFVYFGDNARVPYGTKPGAEIVDLTRQGTERLFQMGCRLVIIACNTASAVALRRLQRNWLPYREGPPVNILGIVVPTIEQVTGVSWSQTTPRGDLEDHHEVAIFATARMVESEVYPIEIAKRRRDIIVHQEACPGLASAIEAGADPAALKAMVESHVGALSARLSGRLPRRAILGCTHYTLVADFFAAALGPEVEIIDQPNAVAASLKAYLERHPEYIERPGRGACRFLSTGWQDAALAHAETFWGERLAFEPV